MVAYYYYFLRLFYQIETMNFDRFQISILHRKLSTLFQAINQPKQAEIML